MIPLEEARARLVALAPAPRVVRAGIDAAAGLVLAEDLAALRDQPGAPVSAMDGLAVRTDDMAGPWRRIGESRAGHPFAGAPAAGEAVRIATGAVVPPDCGVIVQEDIATRDGRLHLAGDGPDEPRRHVREAASDFARGAALLARGELVTPARLALAIAGGHATLAVHPRPLVAIIDTGDELAPPGADPGIGRVPASNALMLAALLAPVADTLRIGPVPDRREALAEALDRTRDADLLITSGGASVGDHDLVQPALVAAGATIDFWRVAIRPGKPLMAGIRGRQPVVGLPGNPVSAYVTAMLFVLPMVEALSGRPVSPLRTVTLPTADALPPTGQRAEFLRARFLSGQVLAMPVQDSGALRALAQADCLIMRPVAAPAAAAGDAVPCIPLPGAVTQAALDLPENVS